MTDQLESDLRTMLAERAARVVVDPADGESAITDRLRAGGPALADVVPLAAAPRRGRWLVAAAAAVVTILGVATWAAQDDDSTDVVTDPAPEAAATIFTAVGSPESVAGSYLFDRLDLAPGQELTLTRVPADPGDPADLTGVSWRFEGGAEVPPPSGGLVVLRALDADTWEVVEAYSDGASLDEVSRTATAITVRATGPAGSYLELSVHRLDGTSVTAGGCGGPSVGPTGEPVDEGPVGCDLVDEPIPFADEPLTVRLSIVTAEGVPLTLEERLVALPDDVADAPLGTATTVEGDGASGEAPDAPELARPGESQKDLAERVMREVLDDEAVTMDVGDRANGDVYVEMETMRGASVVAFVTFDEALGVHRLVGLQTGKFQEFGDQGRLSIPDEGSLTLFSRASLTDDPVPFVADLPIDHMGTDHGPFDLPDDGWLQMALVTDDGRILHHLSRR